jgi:hypothetical protein
MSTISKRKPVREEGDRRRLAEGQPEPDRLLDIHLVMSRRLILEQGDEAAAAGVRPQVRMQQGSELRPRLEGDLAG